jgi:hypothetical protein
MPKRSPLNQTCSVPSFMRRACPSDFPYEHYFYRAQ